ncbi:probable 2-oxoglutarate-dependent dioxygenase aop1 [Phtheirospermum japonicum]|uniref:Probable 2-oxoglutarate-dependent dioxygenase aop1 n=1 Tax=Phtheirospermum japonicum TaxID=374723 RepID=A0A830B2G3_9LAMI|nr:probable 2-oxoglutarate-dependent dioxygenase aop1 [Phtheirospermum japonicum]
MKTLSLEKSLKNEILMRMTVDPKAHLTNKVETKLRVSNQFMANSQELPKIPIFDLSTKPLNPTSNSWLCKKVQHALEEYGFFIARYENVSSELDEQVFDVLEELFDLPLETKARNTSDLVFYGYVGQLPHAPLHESMGIPEATTINAVQSFTNLMWPSGHNTFCESIHSYAKLVSELEQIVDRLVFESYGAHKHYESHVNGLQVQLRNGEWISVDVPPGTFVVMAGDAYEAWSNGRILAARHQVVMEGDKPRYCLALFSFNHGATHIPEELVDSDHPLQYGPFDNFGLARFYLSGAAQMTESTAKAYCGC